MPIFHAGDVATLARSRVAPSLLRSAALAAVLLAGAAAPALAQSPAEVSFELSPATAGSGTTLTARVRGDGSEFSGRQPADFVLAAQRGFVFDPEAVAGRCTAQQAKDAACPDDAKMGGGRAVILARNALLPGGQKTFTAALTVHLGAPGRSGDLGTAHVGFSEPETGTRGTAAGRIVRGADGDAFPLEVRFEGIGGGMALPPGTTVELRELELRLGADRTVRRVVTKRVRVKLKRPSRTRSGRLVRSKLVRRRIVVRVRRDLITTPPVCDGTFTARATVRFSDGSDLVRNLSAPCRGPLGS